MLKAKLDEWNAEIDKLSAKADQAEAGAKIEYQKQLEHLKQQHEDLQGEISDPQQAGESAWNELAQGLENSWEIFKKSFAKAKTEFEQGYKEGKAE